MEKHAAPTLTMNDREDPIELFRRWLADAEAREPGDPTATALATADSTGKPSVRMVLLRGFDQDGFVFYTNLASQKAKELQANPRAALCFHWKSLDRQVRVSGDVEPVSGEEADAYFATRERSSQIGAWASRQSEQLEGRFKLETRVAKYAVRFGLGKIPRPAFWSGYRLRPTEIEFWQKRPFRLHERLLYYRSDNGWQTLVLYP